MVTTYEISTTLDDNVKKVKDTLGKDSDLLLRTIEFQHNPLASIAIVHFDGISDEQRIIDSIIKPLQEKEIKSNFSIEWVQNEVNISNITKISSWNKALQAIFCGDTAIFVEGSEEVLIASTRSGQSRSVAEPTTETVIRGPKDCFTENIRTNTSLIRQRVRNSNLRMEGLIMGEITQTDVAIVYMEGIVEEELLQDVKSLLDNMELDSLLDSSYLELIMESNTISPFPTVLNTERPDIVVGNILEGRVAILVHGSPFALIVPAVMVQFMQSPEDYYQNHYVTSFIRILRIFSFFLSLLGPALYIAITTFHPVIIPTTLLVSLSAQREGIPFPALVEALLMELTFEILREAGVRMPRAVGQAVSIVGALVVGQAAVEAGLVSIAMVLIVAITAISTFTLPHYSFAVSVRLLRFLFMFAASFIGLYGIILGLIMLLVHLVSLESFGTPYLSPISPFHKKQQKDIFIRSPFKFLQSTHPKASDGDTNEKG